MRLWEAKHDYYCNEGNYFSNDCGSTFKSFSEFMDGFGDSDMDYNLVFRWDWQEGEDNGASEYNGDDYYRNGKLLVFIMGQRKGRFSWCEVDVCRADEPAVIEFLRPRFEKILQLWTPLSEPPQ